VETVLTASAATLCIQLGYFLWKLSADRLPRIGATPIATILRALAADGLWSTGLVATTAGWLLFIRATAVGEISVVQPLMSAGDVLLILLAVVFLHERLHAMEWIGVGLTVLGAAALAAGVGEAAPATVHGERLALLLCGVLVVALALLAAGRAAGRAEVTLGLVVGLAFGTGAVLTEAMTGLRTREGLPPLGWSMLLDPLLAAVIAANVAGLVLLQAAFQRGRAALIVPLQLAVANVLTVLAAVTAFDEAVTASRGLAIAVIVGGTVVLHLRTHAEPAA
jgi:uncharacterized membrane protein